nr:MAG TPA: hypothetical protein [Caudoviricetes sp.]
MSKPSELELKVREEQRDFLKSKATQYRKLAISHMYTNVPRYNQLIREARRFDLCADLIYTEQESD